MTDSACDASAACRQRPPPPDRARARTEVFRGDVLEPGGAHRARAEHDLARARVERLEERDRARHRVRAERGQRAHEARVVREQAERRDERADGEIRVLLDAHVLRGRATRLLIRVIRRGADRARDEEVDRALRGGRNVHGRPLLVLDELGCAREPLRVERVEERGGLARRRAAQADEHAPAQDLAPHDERPGRVEDGRKRAQRERGVCGGARGEDARGAGVRELGGGGEQVCEVLLRRRQVGRVRGCCRAVEGVSAGDMSCARE
jgi:hypothetical protein